MNVTLVCFGVMREYLPPGGSANEAELDVDEGATVGDVADALGAPRGLVYAVLVNDEPARLDSHLSDGDRLTLMPHYSGGERGGARG